MTEVTLSPQVRYIGCDDHEIDLFESQYVVPDGVSYNSYLILDEKVAILDTVDRRATETWFANLERELSGREPDYLIVHHMEPDHASNLAAVCEKYPGLIVVGNAKTFTYIDQFFTIDLSERKYVVKDGDALSLGEHQLQFLMTPMVHWPEVMMSYEAKDQILFSADGFGKFGALDAVDDDWACEARRYYFNIVGKYGASVQSVLKKAAALDIRMIAPLHGPVLTEDLGYYIQKYDTWSSYEPEDAGVTIAYASIHGNTKKVAEKLAELLGERGQKVSLFDLCRDDMAEAIEDAFRYDRLVLASVTYDGVLFPAMEDFLYHLRAKAYQKRTIGIIENGTWAPMAGKLMRESVEGWKDCTIVEPMVTIHSAMKESDVAQLEALADALV